MPGQGDIRAGRAFVELFLKSGSFFQDLATATSKIGTQLANVAKPLATASAAVIAPLTAAVVHFTTAGDAANKMSERIGASTESLSELTYAAGQSGSNAEELEGHLRKMQQTIADFADGNKSAVDTMRGLGVSMDMLKETPDAQLEMFADRIAAIENPAERTAAAISIFGKAGTRLLPLLSGGAKGIQELRREAQQLGQSISSEDAEAAINLGDAFDRIKSAIKGVTFNVGASLAEPLQKLADIATNVAMRVIDWVKNNQELLQSIVRVAAVVGGALGVLAPLAFIVGKALVAFGGLGSVVGMVTGTISTLLAAALSPAGIVIAAIAAGVWLFRDSLASVAEFIANTFAPELEGITAFFGTMVEDFQSAAGGIMEAWSGIVDAIKAGDLALAAQIAWAGLEVVWRRGTQSLNKLWLDAKFFALETWNSFKFGAAEVFVVLFGEVQAAWASTIAFLESTWDSVTTKLANSWQKAQLGVGELLIAAAEKSGAISKDFAKAWRESLKTPIEQDIKSRTEQSQQRQTEIESQRKERLTQIREQMSSTVATLESEKATAMKQLESADASERIAAAEALVTAEKKLVELREKATVERVEATGSKKKVDKAPEGETEFSKAATQGKVSVTFSSAGLLALGAGGGSQSEVVRETREMKKEIVEQRKATERVGKHIETSNAAIGATLALMKVR